MSKGAARNMQRISIKVAVGVAPPLEGGVKQPPVIMQLADIEHRRLARIRRCFELEQQIKETLRAGGNVGMLREALEAVRTGRVEVPLSPAIRRATRAPNARAGLRRGPASRPEKRIVRTVREMAADLKDIAKGKLTLTGASAVKGLLERFDRAFVDEVLQTANGFIDKVVASAVYGLAPSLSAADGIVLVDALDERANQAGKAAPRPVAAPTTVSLKFEMGIQAGSLSVDDITGEQYLSLKAKGWVIKGALVYDPNRRTPPKQETKLARQAPSKVVRRSPLPQPPVAMRKAPTKARKPGKAAIKNKVAPVTKPVQVAVPLSAEARNRLHQASAFKAVEVPRTPKSVGPTVTRSGFVQPPGEPKINWNDSSEDGSRWDR